MPFVLGTLIGIAGIILAYRTIRPMTYRRRRFDAGAVSESWLEHQRGQSDDSY